MKTSRRTMAVLLSFFVVFALSTSIAQDKTEKLDQQTLEMINRIRYEGFHNSKIMEIANGLIEDIGPRLTGSPNMKKANEWTRQELESFGLVNAKLDPWTPFGRGWSNEYANVRMVSPDIQTLIAYPKAWTPGTDGPVRAQVVRVQAARSPRDLERYKGKLAGKIVLYGDDGEVKPSADPLFERYSDKQLFDLEQYRVPGQPNVAQQREFQQRARMQRQINKFWDDEKVLAIIDHSRGSINGGTVFVQQGGSYKVGLTAGTPQLTMATEQWNRIARILADKKPVELEINVKNTFYDDAMTQWDTTAEIPGTDKKDELVMLGAHLDSWHTGTGATDNAAGSIVMMEAVRILKALGVKPRRTIRIGLWSGEEEGLLGSQWYVSKYFGTRPESTDPDRKGDPTIIRRDSGPITPKAEQAKVSVYFNVDNGTGKIRGIYTQENSAVAPIFDTWMKPFHDLGMDTLSTRNTGGTDHLSFDAVGIPGFQFIQDPIEYDTRTHHSNMDVYDRLQPEDLKQMAVIVASFVYMAAERDQMFPRKPIEPPLPPLPPAEDENAPAARP
jgi:carboxypeptidase Q